METFENNTQNQSGFAAIEDEATGLKQRLGQLGRRIKRVDLRSRIVDHPFPAIGIALGVGALIGLARPMPKRGRVSGAAIALLSTIGFRLVREAAMVQLGQYAKGLLSKDQQGMQGMQGMQGTQANVPQSGVTTY
jgi:hypothetical protein